MILLVLLAVFWSAFILSAILAEQTAPLLFKSYSQSQSKRVSRVTEKLEDSFIFLEKKKRIFLYVSPLVFAGIGFVLINNPLGLILGFVLGLSFPGLMVKIIKQNRIRKFQSQMVDSLMVLASSLKAGLSFMQAIEVLCEEMPAPVSQEFGMVLKENKWGISLEESLRSLRKRVPLEEVNLLVSSILVARETGGELTKVFTRLTETIRNNLKLKEKVATLTLQGRMQGVIMSLLPVGFTFFIYKQNPHHFDIMWESQMGRILIAAAILAQLIGMYLIKRISTIKI